MNIRLTTSALAIFAALSFSGCQNTNTASSAKQDPGKKLDAYWTEFTKMPSSLPSRNATLPDEHRLLKLDLPAFRQHLTDGRNNADSLVEISMPLADLRMAKYRVSETNIIPRGMRTTYPEIVAYTGKAVNDQNSHIRIEITRKGLSATISETEKIGRIEPYTDSDSLHYISYFRERRTKKNISNKQLIKTPKAEPIPQISR